MKEIEIQIKDSKLIISINPKITTQEFLKIIKNKLENIMIIKEKAKKEVVLNLKDRNLDNREILQLFDIFNELEIFYLSKVICNNKFKDNLIIYKGNFRGGQTRFFPNSALIVGTINKGSKVIVNGDLYVLGKLEGEVELKSRESRLYCENINNCLVKIADTYRLYSEDLFDKEIFLDDKKIIERDYKRGEINYVKSNSSYLG